MTDETYPGASRITEQLKAAVDNKNHENIRQLLQERNEILQNQNQKTDDDIKLVFRHALDSSFDDRNWATTTDPLLSSCSKLLYECLSNSTKQRLRSATADDDFSLLHLAVEKDLVDFVTWLVDDQGCNVHQVNHLDETTTDAAMQRYIFHYLNDSATAPNQDTVNKLDRCRDVIRLLLAHGGTMTMSPTMMGFVFQVGRDDIVSLLDQYHVISRETFMTLLDNDDIPRTNKLSIFCITDMVSFLVQEQAAEVKKCMRLLGELLNDEEIPWAAKVSVFRISDMASLVVQHKVAPVKTCITILGELLCDENIPRETKLSIVDIFVQRAKTDCDTALRLQSLFFEERSTIESIRILLEAGVSGQALLYRAIPDGNATLCRLLVEQYRINPLIPGGGGQDGNGNYLNFLLAPLNAAAQLQDSTILEQSLRFLNQQQQNDNGEQFSNAHGDLPMHVLCRDPGVPLPAIQLAVEQYQRDALDVANNEGLRPIHIAASSGVSISVLNYLLRECPQALGHLPPLPTNRNGNNATLEAVQAQVENLRAEKDAGMAENARLRALPADKDADLADKDADLADKDTALADKDTALADKDTEIAHLRALIDSLGDVKHSEMEDTQNASSGSNSSTIVDKSSSTSSGINSVVDPASTGVDVEQEQASLIGDTAAAPPPSKKAKTGH